MKRYLILMLLWSGVAFAQAPIYIQGSPQPGALAVGPGIVQTGSDGRAFVAQSTLSTITNSLGADVAMNNASNYFDGPSVAQGTVGTWFASGTVTLLDSAQAFLNCKLWDGTTVISSSLITGTAAFNTSISLSGAIANPAGNIRISCKDSAITGAIKFNSSGNSKDSTVIAVRLQ